MLQPWKLHQKKGMCQLASCLPLPTWLSAWIGIAGYGSCRKGVGKVLDFGNLAIVDLWSNLQNVHNSPKPEEKLEIRKQTSQASLLVISSGFKFETLKTSQNCSPTWAACCWHRHGQAPGCKAGWQRAKVCHEYRDNRFGVSPYTILASANVQTLAPMIWFQAENCKAQAYVFWFFVSSLEFSSIKMVEAARRLSLFFGDGWSFASCHPHEGTWIA